MSYESHQLHLLEGGSIFPYTRNGNPTFHAWLKLDGDRGYLKITSTGRRRPDEAYAVAKGWFDDLKYKSRHGLIVRSHTFSSAWRKWWVDAADQFSTARSRYLEGTANRYFLPFFGERLLESVNDEVVRQYWKWRQSRWSSPEGREIMARARNSRTTPKPPYKQKLGNVAIVPAAKSLQMEQTALRQLFNWLHRRVLSAECRK
jgi:hypothetical protein